MSTLVEEIRDITGVDLGACSSCASCRVPVELKSALDLSPDNLVRLILDDKRDVVFASKTIWLLSGCMGRSIVCEKGVRLGKALAGVRKLAGGSDIREAEPEIGSLKTLLGAYILGHGRISQRWILRHMRRILGAGATESATEAGQELAMMLRGKLRLFPQKVKDLAAVRRAEGLDQEGSE